MLKIDNSGSAKVSVIIPAYNEASNLPQTLQSLSTQDFDQAIELIVVDNNSTDNTAEIANAFGAKVVAEKNKGTRFAYDAGFRNAQGEIVVATNADVLFDKHWLRTIVETYQTPGVVGVGTHIKFHNCPEYINWLWFIIHNVGRIFSKLGYNDGLVTFWGASMSSTKKIYQEVGGLNHGTNTNEDQVYTRLIAKKGKTIYTYKTVASLDGRRYAGAPWTVFYRWLKGVGGNSIMIGLGFDSKVKDFEDIRK